MSKRVLLPKAWRQLRREQARIVRVSRASAAEPLRAIDPDASAAAVGLRYVNDGRIMGMRRLGRGRRVRYVDAGGRPVSSRDVARIKSLAIPPAWTDVWICPHDRGHVQATGRDARGRKQYRYHPRWKQVRDEVKYGRMLDFAAALPKLRARTDTDLRRTTLSREKVIATVVALLEKTLIRVGNEEYARANRSYGLTTMRNAHAKVKGRALAESPRPASAAAGRRSIVRAIESSAERLGNTVAVCRNSYVHPAVLDAFLDGDVIAAARRRPAGGRRLSSDEAAVAKLIARRTRAVSRPTRKVA